MCNAGGDSDEGFMGGSGVWGPFMGRIGGWEISEGDAASKAGLRTVEVDLDILKVSPKLYCGV